MLKLYNTLTKSIETFQSIQPNEVDIYSCGPTVYHYAHLGNFRTYLTADILRRVLEYNGYTINHVVNITDVGHLSDNEIGEDEDKIEAAARREKKTAWEVAKFYTRAFLTDWQKLNLKTPTRWAKATNHIDEMIELIKVLEIRGMTYQTRDGVYFDTTKAHNYTELSGKKLEDLLVGARVEPNADKKHPADFALWKFSPKDGLRRQMEWESPWGVGFPGWHIECSAMSTKYLGQPFDIHTGGVDLIFPHHTNEIAQSYSAYQKPLANFWLHNEFMMVDGQKMSKSLNNIYTVSDITNRNYHSMAFRLLALQTHYQKPLNFTWDSLTGAQEALKKLTIAVRILPQPNQAPVPQEWEERFKTAINNNLGLPEALAIFWEMIKSRKLSNKIKANLVKRWDQVLGLDLASVLGRTIKIPAAVHEWARQRAQMRNQGDFAAADQLRKKIEQAGFEIQDTPEGSQLIPRGGN